MKLDISTDGGKNYQKLDVFDNVTDRYMVWVQFEDGRVIRSYVNYWNPEWDTIEAVYDGKKVKIGLVQF
jgi:hypothetical protein